LRTSSPSVEMPTRVTPRVSSTTCASIFLSERYTTSRGRSAVPTTFFRTRRCRRSRRSRRCFVASAIETDPLIDYYDDRRNPDCGLLRARLARLTTDHLALVLDALPLVRLGRAQRPDLSRHLTDDFLVRTFHLHHRGRNRPQRDPLGGLVVDGM